MAAPFRVLAIDGGEIRGIIPAAVLVDLERRLAPRPQASAFDLIVGTSTGGIIALGLTAPDGEHPRILEAVATGGGRLAHLLLARLAHGERFRYWRLQTTVGSCSFTMDDSSPENIDCLYQRARELVSQKDEELSAITHALAT